MEGLEEKTHKVARSFTYRYYVSPTSKADSSKPALLLHHGFLDRAHIWSKLLPVLDSLPNILLIPGLLGYGGTSKPTHPKHYAFDAMTQDLSEILDAEGIDKIVSAGHDWGAASAQRFYNLRSERTVAVVLLNVAYLVPDKEHGFNLDALNAMTNQHFDYPIYQYWSLFLAPDAAELFESNLDRAWEIMQSADAGDMKAMFCEADSMRKYLSDHSIPALKLKPHGHAESLKSRAASPHLSVGTMLWSAACSLKAIKAFRTIRSRLTCLCYSLLVLETWFAGLTLLLRRKMLDCCLI